LINPAFDQARSGHIIVPMANFMRGPEESHQLHVVRAQFLPHFLGRDAFIVVVFKALVPRNIADGPEARASSFARAFRNSVRHPKNLISVVIQQKVVVAEMAACHMPVKVFRLHIENENIGSERSPRSHRLPKSALLWGESQRENTASGQ
jgi:hypothetical protein